MYTLFIDTHDRDLIIGLYKDGKVISEERKESMRNHSDFTMPLIEKILSDNNLNVKELNEIIVVNGPGSFTGVRIGVTIAKTLAYTLNIPIKSITSLEMFALSNNTNSIKIPIIRDVKGVFYGVFDENNNLIEEMAYKSNSEFNEYIKLNNYESNIIENVNVNLDKIYAYLKDKDTTNPHKVNPIYIKVIEALKND